MTASAIAAAMLFAGLASSADAADLPVAPDVVLIVVDDMGWGDLPSQHPGDPGYEMPNLARLEREGTRFTDFLVSQPVCSASRASIMTGCYANRIGITGALGPTSRRGLHADETTIAEVLDARGYRTGMFGKWHLGHGAPFLPTRHGFDASLTIPYSNDMWSQHPESPGAWPDTVPLTRSIAGASDEDLEPIFTMHQQAALTGRFTDAAVAFIEDAVERDAPFFVCLAHPQPHVPLAAAPAFRGRSERGLYGDVMEEIDASAGAIMDVLERRGRADRTLFVFTSDNGPWLSYGDHAGTAADLREGKGTTFEGGLRVPCLVRWPGVVPAGQVSEVPWMTIDLLPTIEEATRGSSTAWSAPEDRPIDGRSAMPLLRGEPDAGSPNEAYLMYYHGGDLEAVRSGRWKLHLRHRYRTMDGQPVGRGGIPGFYRQATIEPSLFDLDSDPGEQRDVSAEHPDVLARLMAHVERARADLGDRLAGGDGPGRRGAGTLPPTGDGG